MPRRREEEGARRPLEAWDPPPNAGEPVGCIATTYTFDPIFFEEHCLSRFLRLETDPREDGAAYLIEREEKLAITRVSVLVDSSHADGSASPRWDVLPVRVPGAIFHPKVAVLAWDRWVRVLIGSANLTEPAYRKNQEVFGVLDFRDGGPVPVALLRQTIAFIERIAGLAPGDADQPGPKARLVDLLGRLSQMVRDWTAAGWKPREFPQVLPVFLGPSSEDRQSVLDRLGQMLRERGGPAHSAHVLSPFFDRVAGGPYRATTALLASLTDRGQRYVEFVIPADRLPDGRLRLRAPKTVLCSARKTFEFEVYPLTEEADGETRPVHAKAIWLWNDRWSAYMIGSSNFTGAGLGLAGRAPNVEANLTYVFPEDTAIVRRVEKSFPPFGEKIRDLDDVLWEPPEEVPGEERAATLLPAGFEEALYEPGEIGGMLRLHFGRALPTDWEISHPDVGVFAYSAADWSKASRPSPVELSWSAKVVPRALTVQWQNESGRTFSSAWPVGVTDPSRLAPPDELRNLSLDTLVEILGSRLPLHEAVRKARQAAACEAQGTNQPTPELDPHRRVRTETFLLQRTRRVARAIEHLVERLNRPAVHLDGLVWRLRGPVGPLALARALVKDARSSGEACFLLSEVVLSLKRADVAKIAVGVDVERVRDEIAGVIEEIGRLIRERLDTREVPGAMAEYVTKALAAARR